jgi:hypothetical protein
LQRRTRSLIVLLLTVLIVLFVAAKLRYSGRPSTTLAAAECNADLWKHVYERERLQVIEPCAAVEGRVVSVHPSSDGDLHIALDPAQKSALNLINLTHAHGTVVVEAVCDHPPAKGEAGAACEGFTSRIKAPRVGERVRVVGAYVTDRDNGWNEVHPVTRIESLP